LKILLVRPPAYSKSLKYPGGPRFGLPTSLLYLAAVLEKEQIEVKIYDALIDFSWENIDKDEIGNYHIGASWSIFGQKVLEQNPDIVGITNSFSDFFSYAIRAAEEIKARDVNIITVVGGPHATSSPESFFFYSDSVDYIVRGEGEISFLQLIKSLIHGNPINKVQGITYKEGKHLISTSRPPFIKNLDDLPFPAYHLVPMERYFDIVRESYPSRFMWEYHGSEREVSLITSRGCPFHCIFCGNFLHMGRRWRYHSVAYILRHMELLISRYGVRHFHLEDDNIALNIRRLKRLLDGVQKKGWNITWDTPNGIRADGLTIEILRKIKGSGCTYLIIGIESGSQKVLDQIIRKKLVLEKVIQTSAYCKRLHLDLHGFFVVGFPGEGQKEIKKTFDFAKNLLWRYDVIPHLCLARPLPGTELYKICEKKGYLTEPLLPEIGSSLRSEIYPRVMIQTELFSPKDIMKWVNNFNNQIVLIIILKTVIFLCLHPQILTRVSRQLWRWRKKGFSCAIKRLFFGGLFFKFNYLSKPTK
jgi:anaerobic magnesium-protoporphyrin IX monomethyl ester cyclase